MMMHPTYPLQKEEAREIEDMLETMQRRAFGTGFIKKANAIRKKYAAQRTAQFPGWKSRYEAQFIAWLNFQKSL